MNKSAHETPVLIVGAGPVGMTLAIDLALRGVRTTLFERRQAGEFLAAKTNMTNIRSMEHFRRWGIADKLRKNDWVSPSVQRDVAILTRLNGYLIHRFEKAYESPTALEFASERGEWAPNEPIEKTLYDRANELPLIHRLYEHDVEAFNQDEDGVTVDAVGPNGRVSVRGKYLVVANGARSELRRKFMNVPMEGTANLARSCAWNLRAPRLKDLWTAGPIVSMAYFYNEDRFSDLIIPQEGLERFVYILSPLPEGFDGDDWEQVKRALFRSAGAEFEVEPVSGGEFSMHSLVAPRFDFGRVLLAGDAAHLVSSQGGFGMNLGIGDAVDLGWKLTALLQGWGGPMLLSSYSIDRREVVNFIARGMEQNQAAQAFSLVREGLERPGPEGDAVRAQMTADVIKYKTQQFNSIGGQLGYRYASSPIIVGDGTSEPPPTLSAYTPSARPGNRAPHIWMADGSSLYDHIGNGLTLLDLDGIDLAGLRSLASERKVPIDVLSPSGKDRDALRDLYKTGAALIRSDHHVAWRGDRLPDDVGGMLDIVTGNRAWRGAPASAEAIAA